MSATCVTHHFVQPLRGGLHKITHAIHYLSMRVWIPLTPRMLRSPFHSLPEIWPWSTALLNNTFESVTENNECTSVSFPCQLFGAIGWDNSAR